MAEPVKNRKVSLREIMDEIANDEAFSEEERDLARKKALEVEYQEWCKNDFFQKQLRLREGGSK